VEAASQGYFGKSVRYLNLPESALLGGILRNAYIYSPTQHPESAKTRRSVVLKRMALLGYISEDEAQSAMEAPLGVIEPRPSKQIAPYFVDYIRDYLVSKYGHETVYKGGLKVYTTLDLGFRIWLTRYSFPTCLMEVRIQKDLPSPKQPW